MADFLSIFRGGQFIRSWDYGTPPSTGGLSATYANARWGHGLRTLLLAVDSRSRRVRAIDPGAGGRTVSGCGARTRQARRSGGADAFSEWPPGPAATLRAAFSQGRAAGHRADGQHPAVLGSASWTRSERRGRAAVDPRTATHDGGFPSRNSRHPSSHCCRSLLRGAEERGAPPGRGFSAEPGSQILRLLREDARERRSRTELSDGRQADIRGSVPISNHGRSELCIPARHGEVRAQISAARRPARPSTRTPADRRISCLAEAHPLPQRGNLPG